MTDVQTVKKMGANGAMIGRVMLGNPWIFSKDKNYSVVLEHFDLMLSYYGKSATTMFRKHAAWYAAGKQGASGFREKVNRITDENEMRKVIVDFFAICH